jgi:glycosyltransferase involved in cell wall biosynthesis
MNTINYVAPINNTTGYGITSTNILKSLVKNTSNDISLFPVGGIGVDSVSDKQLLENLLSKTQQSFNNKAPCFKVWHPHDLSMSVGKGKYGALIFFELNNLKTIEQTHINNLDVVFVASKWGKNVLQNNGIKTKIVVSPLAVDTQIFTDHEHPKQFTKDTYKFVNIGKWEIRKGHDFLLEAFNNAFTENDDVELFMINHNPFLSAQENQIWVEMYKNSKLGNKITPIARVPTHLDLAKFIRDMDCGFFPARAEGWNNEILEVMALNKPVITTNYSAHTEYCTQDNAFLIDIDELTLAEDGKFFNGEGKWANLGDKQMDQAVEYLRKVYNNNIKTNPKGFETAKTYTWDNTASIITTEMFDANTQARA